MSTGGSLSEERTVLCHLKDNDSAGVQTKLAADLYWNCYLAFGRNHTLHK